MQLRLLTLALAATPLAPSEATTRGTSVIHVKHIGIINHSGAIGILDAGVALLRASAALNVGRANSRARHCTGLKWEKKIVFLCCVVSSLISSTRQRAPKTPRPEPKRPTMPVSTQM